MGPLKKALIFVMVSVSIQILTAESGGLKIEEENLSSHLKTIDSLISNLSEQKNGPCFGDITVYSVKQAKSMLVKVVDHANATGDLRLLMLENIKDLHRVEDWLADKEPELRQIEDYCDALIENRLFKKDHVKMIGVDAVLKYVEQLNAAAGVDKSKLKIEIDSIIRVLAEEARHKPEMERLVDFLETRRCVIDAVLDMDRYIQHMGFTLKDLNDLLNMTLHFAPLVDRLFDHKRVVNEMNEVYSSLFGKSFVENAEDARKMSVAMKLEMFLSIEKVQGLPTKWSKLVEELKQLSYL